MPAAARTVEDPPEVEAAGLAGQPADDVDASAGFAEGACDEVGVLGQYRDEISVFGLLITAAWCSRRPLLLVVERPNRQRVPVRRLMPTIRQPSALARIHRPTVS